MKHTQAWQHCPRCDYTEIEVAYTVDDAGARGAFRWGFIAGGVAVAVGQLLLTMQRGWT